MSCAYILRKIFVYSTHKGFTMSMKGKAVRDNTQVAWNEVEDTEDDGSPKSFDELFSNYGKGKESISQSEDYGDEQEVSDDEAYDDLIEELERIRDQRRNQRVNQNVTAGMEKATAPLTYLTDAVGLEDTPAEDAASLVGPEIFAAAGMAGKGKKIAKWLGLAKKEKEASNFVKGIKSAPESVGAVKAESQEIRKYNPDATNTFWERMLSRVSEADDRLMRAGADQAKLDEHLQELEALPTPDVDKLLEIAKKLKQRRSQ